MKKVRIGVDVGGTTINIGAVNDDGQITEKVSIVTNSIGGSDSIISSIIEGINRLLKSLKMKSGEIKSIGLGFPGTVNSKQGIVIFAPNIFFENVDVKTDIVKTFGCQVYLAQDSRAAAWGEFKIGEGNNFKDMAVITIGTGIGCGLILNNKIYHGANNTAGEFGHQLIDPLGPECNCGRRGCLETFCAGLAIVRAGKDIGENISVNDVYDLAMGGNPKALKITEQVVTYLGVGITNLINLTSIELIAISGGISNAPDKLLLNPLSEFVKNHVYPMISNKIRIVHSSLGENAPLVGAALLDASTEY